jgi:hypothetical protein
MKKNHNKFEKLFYNLETDKFIIESLDNFLKNSIACICTTKKTYFEKVDNTIFDIKYNINLKINKKYCHDEITLGYIKGDIFILDNDVVKVDLEFEANGSVTPYRTIIHLREDQLFKEEKFLFFKRKVLNKERIKDRIYTRILNAQDNAKAIMREIMK